MPFSMRQQTLDKLCQRYKILCFRLTKYCRDVSPVSPAALTPMLSLVSLLTNTLPGPSASEITTS